MHRRALAHPGHRPYRIIGAVAVALTLGLAVSGDVAQAAPQARVLLGDCGSTGYGGHVKPRRWDYGCTGVWDLFAAKWRRWGRPVARATGKTMLNTCDPSCAEGAVYRYRARVKVSRIRRCEDSDGNVDRYYTRLRLRYRVPAGDPFPAGPTDQTMPIACLSEGALAVSGRAKRYSVRDAKRSLRNAVSQELGSAFTRTDRYSGSCTRRGNRRARFRCSFTTGAGDTEYSGRGALRLGAPFGEGLGARYDLRVTVSGCDDTGCREVDRQRWRGTAPMGPSRTSR